MAYVEDTSRGQTFPCGTIGVTANSITANMSSRAGFLNLSQGAPRAGRYTDNEGNQYSIALPGAKVGTQQQLEFTRT